MVYFCEGDCVIRAPDNIIKLAFSGNSTWHGDHTLSSLDDTQCARDAVRKPPDVWKRFKDSAVCNVQSTGVNLANISDMADKMIEPEVEQAQDGLTSKPVSRFTRWYRSPLFNVIVVGLISFTQPGIWNALNSES